MTDPGTSPAPEPIPDPTATPWTQPDAAAAPAPPPPPPPVEYPPGYVQGYQQGYQQAGYYVDPTLKSRMAAGLLGIFLGGFGVHRFYLGYNSIGVWQIVATVLTCGLASIWGLVEGIMILANSGITTDAAGRPLRE